VKLAVSLGLLLGFFAACGRTELGVPDPVEGAAGQGGAPELGDECTVDSDCTPTDACVRAVCAQGSHGRSTCQMLLVNCDDGDQCTLDRCDATAGGCVHERAVDADHDGYVGKAPEGLPASCGGADCDDSDPSVFPGAPEMCDGKDNDCNGTVDDGAVYTPQGSAVPVAPGARGSEVTSLIFDGSSYALSFTELSTSDRNSSQFEFMNANGAVTTGPVPVTEINADSFGGSVDFSGTSFLTAWADARQSGNYEIYLTRFDQQAQKLMADRRLTNAQGMSLSPVVRFTGSEYVVIWYDRRFSGGRSGIFAHRISEKGDLVGDEIQLSTSDEDADTVDFDVSEGRLGVAYVVEGQPAPDGSSQTTIRFRSYDLTLGTPSGPVDLGSNGQAPTVRGVNGGFTVAWDTGDPHAWGNAIQAATLDTHSTVLALGAITSGDTHAKDRSLVSFGDHLLLVWAATTTDSERYELWYETFRANDLSVQSARQLLATTSGHDLVQPNAVRGPNGDVGVTYGDSPSLVSYFLRLGCGLPHSIDK
jgi:hypothetical protein